MARLGLWLCATGLLALAFGLYRVWCCSQALPSLFTIGTVVLMLGLVLEIVRDIWRRRPRN